MKDIKRYLPDDLIDPPAEDYVCGNCYFYENGWCEKLEKDTFDTTDSYNCKYFYT